MKLKINNSYAVEGGYLIVRSHTNAMSAENYAIVQLLKGDDNHYISSMRTMSHKELRKLLGVSNKERIEII